MFDGRFNPQPVSEFDLSRARDAYRRMREQQTARMIRNVMNPQPTVYEWIEEHVPERGIAKPFVSALKRRRTERCKAAIILSFGATLLPEERPSFITDEKKFMRNLTKREKRYLDTQFPPCPGFYDPNHTS